MEVSDFHFRKYTPEKWDKLSITVQKYFEPLHKPLEKGLSTSVYINVNTLLIWTELVSGLCT
jgi:hypothetical protein